MKRRTLYIRVIAFALVTGMASCAKKLDLFPQNDLTPANNLCYCCGL